MHDTLGTCAATRLLVWPSLMNSNLPYSHWRPASADPKAASLLATAARTMSS